jgi:aspartate/methionine/tyrosine aminotransferase
VRGGELRRLIAERHQRRSGPAGGSEQVIVLPGACAVYSVAQCLLIRVTK